MTNTNLVPARDGTDRAAILLLTLGEEAAAEILRLMNAREVQQVGTAMAKLNDVGRDEVLNVISDLTSIIERRTSFGVGNDEFLRKVLVNALGEGKADSIIERIQVGRTNKGLETLKWMDPRAVAELIRMEHPQIMAIVLAYLEPDQSAQVISHLPANVRSEIIVRIAMLDGVQPSALTELDEVMEKAFAGKTEARTSVLGGPKAAANIINNLEPSLEGTIMEQISTSDEALSERIQDLIFVFDNLLDIEDRDMQELLRQVQGDQLLMAMKGADEKLKEKILKNMSQRAAEMLRDDLDARGPVRLSDVESAQKTILQTARKLAEAGTIALGNKGEAYV